MKKTLVALAALAATSAFAQVEISGNVDVGYGSKEAINGLGKTYAKTTGVMDGANAPNRIFIKVTEDLGGGMKAKFQNEHGFTPTNAQDWSTRQLNGAPTANGTSADAGATTADTQIPMMGYQTTGTNRGTFVAFEKTGFGEVRAGYLVSHAYNLVAQSGYFVGSENYGALLQNHGITENGGTRANGVDYASPVFGGVKLGVQKTYGGERTVTADAATAPYLTSKAERTSYRIDYANGPLNAGFVHTAYDANRNAQATAAEKSTPSIFGVPSAAVTTTANATQKNTSDILNASYVLGDFKVAAQINKAKVDSSIDANDRELKSAQYGLQYTMGAASVFAVSGKGTAKSSTATVNDITNTQYGVRYNLSKRTTAYYMAGTSKDSAATTAALASKGTFNSLGLAHAF